LSLYVITSALLYTLAINYASLFWLLIILFPLPLFFVALNKKLTCKDSFLWGVIFFTVHLHDIARTIFAMGDGTHILRAIPGLFIIFYMALYPAVWFWSTQKLLNLFDIKKVSIIVFFWTLTLWTYIYCIDHYALWILNRTEGYPLVHPLLTLAHKPHLLTLLPIISKPLLTLLLLLIPATLFLFLYTKKLIWFFTLLLACLPWAISPLLFNKQKAPVWANTIAHLPIVLPKGSSTQAMIDGATHDIKKILLYKPNTNIIVLPESSFYSDDLHKQKNALHAWSAEQLGKKIHIIVGAFRKTKKNYYNCLYWIYNGKLKGYCDKRHTMPLIEKLPNWFAWNWLKNTYFNGHNQLSNAHTQRPQFNLSDCTVIPYICSELYFNQLPDDQYSGNPILLASNDRWFSPGYIPELLLRIAQIKAIEWQRTIIYCSFFYHDICLSTGELYPER